MTKLCDVYVYEGKSGNIVFEKDRIRNGFVHARERQNSVFLKTGHFESYSFSLSMVRQATMAEAKEYDAMKEAFVEKEMTKTVALHTLNEYNVFRLPMQMIRYQVLRHTEVKGVASTRVACLNGPKGQGFFNSSTKVIKL